MKIGSLDTDKNVIVIAEIGNNHEGSLDSAKEMIRQAASAGADIVKFQTIVPDRLVSVSQTDRIQQLGRFRFSYDDFRTLRDETERQGVLFLSTPFDIESAAFLNELVPAFKIASGDNTFFPLLSAVAKTGKPMLISAGLATLEEIRGTCDFVRETWCKEGIKQELAVLHCVVSYPTPPEEANLRELETLRQLGTTIGYSDHTLGIDAAVLSVALGARLIEKHFTLDKSRSSFRDHQLSADPDDLRDMVRRIRQAEVLLGSAEKVPTPSEMQVMEKVRRSIVASRDLSAKTVLKWADLAWVRPGGGIPPGSEELVLNRTLRAAKGKGEMIVPSDLE